MADNLQEYEQMRTLNIFSDEQILKITQNRENYETKLKLTTKTVKDYVEYLKYERSLLALAKEKTKNEKATTSHTIFVQIADRMKQIYENALTAFPQNVRFWDEYIKFLQSFKYTNDIAPAFDKMLQYHDGKPEIWMRAMNVESGEEFNEDRIKGLLVRALQRHPYYENFYWKHFEIELKNKSDLLEHEATQRAADVFTICKDKFERVEVFIELLKITDRFPFAYTLNKDILKYLQEHFAKEPIMWHSLAQRELNGMTTNEYAMELVENMGSDYEDELIEFENLQNNFNEMNIEDEPRRVKEKTRLELCHFMYSKGVKAVNTKAMWNLYLKAMHDVNKDLTTNRAIKRFCLTRAYLGAHRELLLSKAQYLQFIELAWSVNPHDESIEEVFIKAHKHYGNSLELCDMFMRYYVHRNQYQKLKNLFYIVREVHGSQAVNLWILYFTFIKGKTGSEIQAEVDNFIRDLSRQKYATFTSLKNQMIVFLATRSGLNSARTAYDMFTKQQPDCFGVYETMADLESQQAHRDKDAERRCLNDMVEQFGKTRPDVWIRYMRFELYADHANAENIHKKALATLSPDLIKDFNKALSTVNRQPH